LSRKGTITTIYLDAAILEAARAVAARENRSLSQLAEDLFTEYLKAHAAGNPSVPLDKFLSNPRYVACPTLLEAHHFNVRTISQEDLPGWRAATFRFLKRLLDEEGRRKAGGTPE
jgi:hypothetical protein